MFFKKLSFFFLIVIFNFISIPATKSAPIEKLKENFKEKFQVQIQDYKNFTIIKYTYFDQNRKKKWNIASEIHFPQNSTGKVPLIITQHGSSRNGYKFKKEGGKSDEYSKNILKKGLQNGYAVAVMDMFYKGKDVGSNKGSFPNGNQANFFAKRILSLFLSEKIDRSQIFYTGFSWGGDTTLAYLDKFYNQEKFKPYWKAIAAVEPSCNRVNEPVNYDFPILIIKAEKSHYAPKPCIYYKNMIQKISGNKIDLKIINGVNHYFSSDMKVITGIAVNACADNIAIKKLDGTWIRANGQPSSGKPQECFGTRVVSGKNYIKMPEAADEVINFFNKNRS